MNFHHHEVNGHATKIPMRHKSDEKEYEEPSCRNRCVALFQTKPELYCILQQSNSSKYLFKSWCICIPEQLVLSLGLQPDSHSGILSLEFLICPSGLQSLFLVLGWLHYPLPGLLLLAALFHHQVVNGRATKIPLNS